MRCVISSWGAGIWASSPRDLTEASRKSVWGSAVRSLREVVTQHDTECVAVIVIWITASARQTRAWSPAHKFEEYSDERRDTEAWWIMAPDCRILPDPNSVSGDSEPAVGRCIRTANLPGRQDFRTRLILAVTTDRSLARQASNLRGPLFNPVLYRLSYSEKF